MAVVPIRNRSQARDGSRIASAGARTARSDFDVGFSICLFDYEVVHSWVRRSVRVRSLDAYSHTYNKLNKLGQICFPPKMLINKVSWTTRLTNMTQAVMSDLCGTFQDSVPLSTLFGGSGGGVLGRPRFIYGLCWASARASGIRCLKPQRRQTDFIIYWEFVPT